MTPMSRVATESGIEIDKLIDMIIEALYSDNEFKIKIAFRSAAQSKYNTQIFRKLLKIVLSDVLTPWGCGEIRYGGPNEADVKFILDSVFENIYQHKELFDGKKIITVDKMHSNLLRLDHKWLVTFIEDGLIVLSPSFKRPSKLYPLEQILTNRIDARISIFRTEFVQFFSREFISSIKNAENTAEAIIEVMESFVYSRILNTLKNSKYLIDNSPVNSNFTEDEKFLWWVSVYEFFTSVSRLTRIPKFNRQLQKILSEKGISVIKNILDSTILIKMNVGVSNKLRNEFNNTQGGT